MRMPQSGINIAQILNETTASVHRQLKTNTLYLVSKDQTFCQIYCDFQQTIAWQCLEHEQERFISYKQGEA